MQAKTTRRTDTHFLKSLKLEKTDHIDECAEKLEVLLAAGMNVNDRNHFGKTVFSFLTVYNLPFRSLVFTQEKRKHISRERPKHIADHFIADQFAKAQTKKQQTCS